MNILQACNQAAANRRVRSPSWPAGWHIKWLRKAPTKVDACGTVAYWLPGDIMDNQYYVEDETYDAAEAVRKLLAGERVQQEGGLIYWLDRQILKCRIPESDDEHAIHAAVRLNDALKSRWHDPKPDETR